MLSILADITPQTNVSFPILAVAGGIFALVGAVLRVANIFAKINANLTALRKDLHYKVERREFDKWTFDLERHNRDVQRRREPHGLVVPELPPLPNAEHPAS